MLNGGGSWGAAPPGMLTRSSEPAIHNRGAPNTPGSFGKQVPTSHPEPAAPRHAIAIEPPRPPAPPRPPPPPQSAPRRENLPHAAAAMTPDGARQPDSKP